MPIGTFNTFYIPDDLSLVLSTKDTISIQFFNKNFCSPLSQLLDIIDEICNEQKFPREKKVKKKSHKSRH
jgi:hypothetical protein